MADASARYEALVELGRIVLGDSKLEDVMQRVAALAKASIGPVAEASVTLTRGREGWTVATTGDLATVLDETQYALGTGPCMDAGSGGQLVHIKDFLTDERFVEYGKRAYELGGRSSLSVPLPMQGHTVAALNLYAVEVDAFSDDDISLAEEFAAHAAVALRNARLYEQADEQAAQMREAMASRAVIEQAKGVLIATTGCSPERAFDLLVAQSQRENRKLREIAHDLVAQHTRTKE
ncbi:MAG TPA: GAF and ANTAR domain-containing protein [Acidimicrobiales bacterium]